MEAKTARPKNPVRSLFRYLSFLLLSLSIRNTANISYVRASGTEGSRPMGVNCSCLFT